MKGESRTLRLSESRSKVSFDYAECEQSQDDVVGLKEKGEIHHLRHTNGKVKTER